ncbi:MAG: Regulator of RpoS [Planctomycetes bacterium]|nr:Regulator of RpoS [Planctomycetota bacterium]
MSVPSHGVRILLVDDDPVIQRGYGQRLRAEGWDVTTASDGYEALTAAQQKAWDLILLDLRIPYRNGVEVLRLLRQRQETAATTVYVLAQPGDADFVDRAMREGADGVFEKARLGPRDIVHEIAGILDSKRRPAVPARTLPTGPSASVPSAVDDIARRFRKPDTHASGHPPAGQSWMPGSQRSPTAQSLPSPSMSASSPPRRPAVHPAQPERLPPYGVLDEDDDIPAPRAPIAAIAATSASPLADDPGQSVQRTATIAASQSFDTMLNRAVGQAAQLAASLGLPADLNCPVCGSTLLLRLAPDPTTDNGVRGQFRCARCTGG